MPFRIPFAGEGEFFTPESVLSHCFGTLLPMFDTKEANTLRQLCREFKSTVADFPWEDEKTLIRGRVAAWRACFPKARWANVRQLDGGRMTPVVDADFVHFAGLRRLDMRGCSSITDAAFVHLKGIHTLDMAWCKQASITDAAFVHLKGIHTLDMAACRQPAITDAAIAHLKGIHSLSLYGCTQLTSAVFAHLKGVKRLNIGICDQLCLTDDSLKGVEWLNMFLRLHEHIDMAESLGYPVNVSKPYASLGFHNI
jgi:hypothetical protein